MDRRRTCIDASFEVLNENRERMAALAQGALTLMRDQREQSPPSDAELIVEVLLELLERRDDLGHSQEYLYRAWGLEVDEGVLG